MNSLRNHSCIAILLVVIGIFAAIAGCTGSSSPAAPTATPAPAQGQAGATVTIQNFAFLPADISITRGTTVTWMNLDSASHRVVSDAGASIAEGATFSSDSFPKGGTYSFRFDSPGTYPYHCSIHPSMKGTITVT